MVTASKETEQVTTGPVVQLDFKDVAGLKRYFANSLVELQGGGFAVGAPKPVNAKKEVLLYLTGQAPPTKLSEREVREQALAILPGVIDIAGKVGEGLEGGRISHLGVEFTLQVVPASPVVELIVTQEGAAPDAPCPVRQALKRVGLELQLLPAGVGNPGARAGLLDQRAANARAVDGPALFGAGMAGAIRQAQLEGLLTEVKTAGQLATFVSALAKQGALAGKLAIALAELEVDVAKSDDVVAAEFNGAARVAVRQAARRVRQALWDELARAAPEVMLRAEVLVAEAKAAGAADGPALAGTYLRVALDTSVVVPPPLVPPAAGPAAAPAPAPAAAPAAAVPPVVPPVVPPADAWVHE